MKVLSAVFVSCLLLCTVSAAQAGYQFKSFQNPGATVTRVFGMNGHGDLVGTDNTIPGRHAFLVNRDSYVSLDSSGVLGTHNSFARDINDEGDIVGGYIGDDGKARLSALSSARTETRVGLSLKGRPSMRWTVRKMRIPACGASTRLDRSQAPATSAGNGSDSLPTELQ
jgi:hypothetical protein